MKPYGTSIATSSLAYLTPLALSSLLYIGSTSTSSIYISITRLGDYYNPSTIVTKANLSEGSDPNKRAYIEEPS